MKDDKPVPSFLHYALGGGLGHLVRQLAVARSLQQQAAGKSKSTIVANSEFASIVADLVAKENDDRIRFELLPPDCLPTEAESLLGRLLARECFECLIVDVFPRGLGGELANCFANHAALPKVLVARNLPLDYLQQFQIESFVRKNFCQVFRIEPEAPFAGLPQSQLTCPVVFQGRPPKSNPTATRPDRHRVLVVGSGTNAECLAWRELTDELRAIVSANDDCVSLLQFEFYFQGPMVNTSDHFHWPPTSQLAGFDLIVGNAGYNLYWETKLAEVPSVLFARHRKYDDQSLRSNLQWPVPAIELLSLIREELTSASSNLCRTTVENSIDDLTASILNMLNRSD